MTAINLILLVFLLYVFVKYCLQVYTKHQIQKAKQKAYKRQYLQFFRLYANEGVFYTHK